MLRRVRLFKDGAGFVLRIMGLELEELERIPPSEGDHLLHARIQGTGLDRERGPAAERRGTSREEHAASVAAAVVSDSSAGCLPEDARVGD
jgi:hypothetical protein